MVADSWQVGLGDAMHHRLENVAANLSKWAASTFGDIKKRIKDKEKLLQEAQNNLPDAIMFAKCNELSNELDDLHRLEESYWHVRARANELRDGDKNTKYFHHKASQRRKRNRISGLLD